ncbi:MAG: hypothetical protein Q7U68_06565 [Candidatus Roizmanbacteria bacterium]|nr:hypothetical protein [Candidatus Roizmanbacteria bacterium]
MFSCRNDVPSLRQKFSNEEMKKGERNEQKELRNVAVGTLVGLAVLGDLCRKLWSHTSAAGGGKGCYCHPRIRGRS